MSNCNLFDTNFADSVANMCYEKFASLPKSGKPIAQKEWTLLAAIIQHINGHSKIVSIATGTKCVGGSKMSDKGDVINDSHAEVLARRGFVRYLLEEVKILQRGDKSAVLALDENSDKYAVRDGVSFHLFTSHVPCGDASIFPKKKLKENDNVSHASGSDDRKRSISPDERGVKKFKNDCCDNDDYDDENSGVILSDINRTGAKCLPHDIKRDEKRPGQGYHIVGVVRTKPGRGDPTLSVSCSDKILRWNCVGIEGALLSILLSHPIRLSSIVVASNPALYCESAMTRAIINRNESVKKLCTYPLRLLHSNLEFDFSKSKSPSNAKPSPCGIIWCDIAENNHEVCVRGRRLGWNKKNTDAIRPLMISKKSFVTIFKFCTADVYDKFTYLQIKLNATRYRKMCEEFKSAVGIWTVKNDDLLSFQ